MRFDPAVALQYARSIARPRRVGSAANTAIIASLAEQLKAFGCTVTVDPVEFSSPGERAVALHILAAQTLILLTFWAWGFGAWPALAPALMLAVLILGAGRLYRLVARASLRPPDLASLPRWHRWWLARGMRYRTANVVAKVPTRADAKAARPLLLMAHSDSKSQPLSLLARMGLIAAASLAALIFAGLTVLRTVIPVATSAAAVAGLAALVAGVPLVFLYLAGSGNASPGAIDNASGVGLVLHLAECLCANPPDVPVMVLITGAEELGLLGALAFVLSRKHEALQDFRIMNFDGIGTTGKLALVGASASALEELVRAVCREQNIPLGRLPPIGAQYDHLPFTDAGLEALTLVTAGAAALSVHTVRDDVSKLDVDGFRRAGQVALGVLERLG